MSNPNIVPYSVNVPITPDSGMLPRDVLVRGVLLGDTTRPANEATPDTVLYLGLGNEGKTPQLAAEQLAKLGVGNVALVGALPYWEVAPAKAALQGLAVDAVTAVTRDLTDRQGAEPAKLHTLAESQAGPSVAWTAAQAPELFTGKIGFMRSMAIQKPLGKVAFASRMLRTGFQMDQLFDAATPQVAVRAAYRAAQDAVVHGGKALSFALETDIREELAMIAGKKPEDVGVFLAERDKLFTPDACIERLSEVGLAEYAIILPGSHSSPASKAGAQQVALARRWCADELARDVNSGRLVDVDNQY